MDQRVEKFAEILVDYSTKVEKGDKVIITGSVLSEPLIKAVYRRVLEKGAFPHVTVNLLGMEEIYFKYASREYLSRVSDVATYLFKNFDVLIALRSDNNTRALTNVPNEKLQLDEKSTRPTTKIVMDRSAKWSNNPDYKLDQLRWVVTKFPCPAYALEANMSLMEYEDFVYKSVGALTTNPIAYWKNFSHTQRQYCNYLNEISLMEFKSKNCGISFNVKGRNWINCDGRLNMPDGEIFTAPEENSTDGWIRFTYPSIYKSQEVDGVFVNFKNGKCIEARADKGEEFLNKMLDIDPGCRVIGELAIGTNPNITQFTKSILFDEKINKSFHIAFGSGYPESGSKNTDAAIHWDMICDMTEGEIFGDGVLFYKNGEFLI